MCSSDLSQKDWTLNWFAVGKGGATTASPNVPLDTSDAVTGLTSILTIKPNTVSTDNGYLYNDSTRRKRLKCNPLTADENPGQTIVEMNFNTTTSEVMMLLQLEVDYDDCPYAETEVSVGINELGLYASPNTNINSSSCLLFSRYCRPTIYKTSGDAYLFMWYIYF